MWLLLPNITAKPKQGGQISPKNTKGLGVLGVFFLPSLGPVRPLNTSGQAHECGGELMQHGRKELC